MARAVVQTPKLRIVFASFTIQIKHLKATEPGVPEASPGAGQPQCCRQTLQTILWGIRNRFPICWRIRSIASAAVSLIHVWPMLWAIWRVFSCALEQGPMEERLAHLETMLGKSGAGEEVLEFRSTKEVVFEQLSTAPEGESS